MEQGAPVDVFVSAAEDQMSSLVFWSWFFSPRRPPIETDQSGEALFFCIAKKSPATVLCNCWHTGNMDRRPVVIERGNMTLVRIDLVEGKLPE
jgi:hypothetical protein